MNPLQHSKEVINLISAKTDRVILFYSCGKDSIALVDLLSKQFKQVVCVFMYFVKDLEHINKFLAFTQRKYPNVKILQVPHWNLTYIFRHGMYCKPQPQIRLMKLADVDESIRLQTGINYSFFGMKKADSLNRRIMLKTYDQEAINWKTGKVYPLSNWKNGDVLRYIEMNRLPKPIQYSKKASNGVGFNIECFLWLRQHYPQDLKKILTAFPMSEQMLFEYDNRMKKQLIS